MLSGKISFEKWIHPNPKLQMKVRRWRAETKAKCSWRNREEQWEPKEKNWDFTGQSWTGMEILSLKFKSEGFVVVGTSDNKLTEII